MLKVSVPLVAAGAEISQAASVDVTWRASAAATSLFATQPDSTSAAAPTATRIPRGRCRVIRLLAGEWWRATRRVDREQTIRERGSCAGFRPGRLRRDGVGCRGPARGAAGCA